MGVYMSYPPMSAPTKSRRVIRALLIVGGILTAVAGYLALSSEEPAHLGLLAECATGRGLALVDTSGRPFEADLRGHTYVGTTDNVIDLTIRVIGAWEPQVLDLMTDVLEKVYDGQGIVLDVGANTGTLVMVASDHASAVHAVEPWPPVLERLR